jgi:hypothetical protein
MAIQKGFVEKYPDRNPPKSAKGFEWPGHDVTDVQRLAFQKNLTNHLRARGENHREFTRVFLGEYKDPSKGYVIPRSSNTLMDWLHGEVWPKSERARQLAAFLKVSMESLLVDDGQPFEPLPLLRASRATPARRKANGHGGHKGNGAAAHPPTGPAAPAAVLVGGAPYPPPRPAGAKPATLHVEPSADSPDYCNVTISGTVRYDTAMALVNLVGRDQHGMGPRK